MTKHSTNGQSSIPAAPWDALTAWNGPIMAVFGQAGEAYAKGCIEWQQELARFIGERLGEDQRAQQSFSKCRSFSDVANVQQSWALTAAKAYAEGASNLTQIMSRCAQQGITPLSDAGSKPPNGGK